MSVEPVEADELAAFAAEAPPSETTATSLEDRMRAARDQKEQATAEDFPVPGWDSMLWVRLKAIGYRTQQAIAEQSRRVRNRQLVALYEAADVLLAATDGFYEVKDDGETLEETATSWPRLAQRVFGVGEEMTPRQCFIRVVGDERIMLFYAAYLEWLSSERERIAEGQKQDFPATRSRTSRTT